MSEPEQEQEAIDEHTALYQHVHDIASKNTMLYEYVIGNVIEMLPGSQPQAAEEALNMMCVSMSKTPLESLLLIHEFLHNYHSIVQHEQKTEQTERESPYMVRGE
jgi:hypothetical protein